MKKDQPAFPCFAHPDSRDGQGMSGMTLRQYYAARAMQGLMTEDIDFAKIARIAFAQADAMIEAEND